jgi:hypothetical protein
MAHYASDLASPWGGAWSPWDAPGRGGGARPGLAEWLRDAGSPRELEFGGGLFPAFNAELEGAPLQVFVRGPGGNGSKGSAPPPPCPLPWEQEALLECWSFMDVTILDWCKWMFLGNVFGNRRTRLRLHGAEHIPPHPPLVLIGHAASLTPY